MNACITAAAGQCVMIPSDDDQITAGDVEPRYLWQALRFRLSKA